MRGQLVNQGYALSVLIVRQRKIASAQERNTTGREVAGCDGKPVCQSCILQLPRFSFAFQNQRAYSDVSRRRERCGGGG